MTYVNSVNNVVSEYFEMNRKAPILVILLAAVAGIFGWLESQAQSQRDSPPVEEQRQAVRAIQPQPAEGYSKTRSYTGVIQAGRTSQVSFLRSGRLEEVLVDQGKRVVEGQLLARLDTRALQAQVAQLRAQRSRAEARLLELKTGPRREPKLGAKSQVRRLQAELELDELKLERRERLFNQGAIPKENLDELRAELAITRANLESARQSSFELDNGTRPEVIQQAQASVAEIDAALQSLRVQYEDCELRAPFAGRIASRMLDEGTVISPQSAVFAIDEDGSLEAVIDLPGDLQPPHETRLTIGREEVRGTLTASPHRIHTSSFTQEARYKVGFGRPGQPVSLEMEQFVKEPGFWLPVQSLTSAGNGLWQCYTVGPQKTVTLQQLEVLHRTENRLLVRGTLRADDRVIVEGVQSVVTGQQVAVIP